MAAGATTRRTAAGCSRKTITPTIPSAVFATVSEVPRPITWSRSLMVSSDSPIATLISIAPTRSARRVAAKNDTQRDGHPGGSAEREAAKRTTARRVVHERCATLKVSRSGFCRRWIASAIATPNAWASTSPPGVANASPNTRGISAREKVCACRAMRMCITNTSATKNETASTHSGRDCRPRTAVPRLAPRTTARRSRRRAPS